MYRFHKFDFISQIYLFLAIFVYFVPIIIYSLLKYIRITIPITSDIKIRLKNLSPNEFEEYVAKLFGFYGYKKIKLTPPTDDHGADIIMYKNKIKYVVEIKNYSENNKVGRETLQKLQGAAIYYQAIGMIFVTSGFFTYTAIDYAKDQNIHLVDGNELIKMFYKKKKYFQQYIL